MSRRVYVKGKKTYAKGQSPDLSKSNRYQNIISLMSIRVEDVHEASPIDRTGEFYFEVGGKGTLKHDHRVPHQGTINIKENMTYSAKQDFTLWIEFDESDKAKTKQIPIKVRERDASRDDTIIKSEVPVVYGSGTKYEVLKGEGIAVKIKVSSHKTRF
ncbi:MAG: hypothetical protein JSV04_02440 [Candidatus Heimdallarchaeota archaeon]|nr:MAG: hypothetical protein JSV04_02440 [Candidatus Heimdallarchaeota archaeon]